MQRSQFSGVTEAQSELIAFWARLSEDGPLGCPRREDFNPCALRAHLANISLLDVSNGNEAVFRLAGSRLRDLLGSEMRGRPVSELPGDLADIWALGLESVVERRRPIGGLIEGADTGGCHAWLRMPLVDRSGRITLVLCHDELLTPSAAGRRPGAARDARFQRRAGPIAA